MSQGITRRTLRAALALGVVTGSAMVAMAGTAGAEAQIEEVTGLAPEAVSVVEVAPRDVNSTKVSRTTSSVLEMNVCASGEDRDCNERKSVRSALDLIDEVEPTLLILNETCSEFNQDFANAVGDANPRHKVTMVFQPLLDGNNRPKMCDRGGKYGIGVVTSVASKDDRGWKYTQHTYRTQTRGEERRMNLCVSQTGSHQICATQLSNDRRTARRQLVELVDTAYPAAIRQARLPLAGGGTFNLSSRDVESDIQDSNYLSAGGEDLYLLTSDRRRVSKPESLPLDGAKYDALLFDVTDRSAR